MTMSSQRRSVAHSIQNSKEYVDYYCKADHCEAVKIGDVGLYQGQPVTVTEVCEDAIGDYYTVRFQDGKDMTVDCCDLVKVGKKNLPAG